MPSRKRLQAKARKASREAKLKEEEEIPWSMKLRLSFAQSNCSHGWKLDEYSPGGDCDKFIDTTLDVFAPGAVDNKGLGELIDKAIIATEQKHMNVWEDSSKLQWIASAFLGVEAGILKGKTLSTNSLLLPAFAEFIQQYIACSLNESQPSINFHKIKDIRLADERRLVSYLKKRIPCSCLDAKYQRVKLLPKMGVCDGPKCNLFYQKVEICSMMSCESCRRSHYCSRSCQKDHWHSHKVTCKEWSMWRDRERETAR